MKAFGHLLLAIASIGGFVMGATVGLPRLGLAQPTAFHDVRRLPTVPPLQAQVQPGQAPAPARALAIQRATFDLLTGRQHQPRTVVVARSEPPVTVQSTALALQNVPTQSVGQTLTQRLPDADVIAVVTVGDLAEHSPVATVEPPTKGDLGYFRASAFGRCTQRCTSAVAACSGTARDPRSFTKADLKLMERERVELERIRSTIEGEYKRGKFGIDQYKRLMTRYQCGMRVYQTQMASYRRSAG